jgi:hypothetical protein
VARSIETTRLTLEPLHPEHAEEMAEALDDTALHEFIGARRRASRSCGNGTPSKRWATPQTAARAG